MTIKFKFKQLNLEEEEEIVNEIKDLQDLKAINQEKRIQELHSTKVKTINKIISYFKVAIRTLGALALLSMINEMKIKFNHVEIVITRIPDAVLITLFNSLSADSR